jgi:hypothetical protein
MSREGIERFVANLGPAFNHRMSRERADILVEKLNRFGVTDDQWSRVMSRLVSECDKPPSIKEIYAFIRLVLRGSTHEVDPIFHTWTDSTARSWAQPTGEYQDTVPNQFTIDKWKREAVTIEVGKELFRKAYLAAGGNPASLEIITKCIIPQIADYDDSIQELEVAK